MTMATGTVKWFNDSKGFGVITPDEFSQLPEEEQKRYGEIITAFQEERAMLLSDLPKWRREAQKDAYAEDPEAVGIGHQRRRLADLARQQAGALQLRGAAVDAV